MKQPIETLADNADGAALCQGATPLSTTEPEQGVVLVIDDDRTARRVVACILRQAGYEVLTAADGHEGLNYLTHSVPDLVLLDGMMPGLDGFEICRMIRENPQYNDVPIIFLTAMSESSDKARGFMVGGTDFVTKPVDRLELLARIKTHIDLSKSQRQLREEARRLEVMSENQQGRLEQIKQGQEKLLTDPKRIEGLKVAVQFQPFLEAGGDFYEISQLGPDSYGVLVVDISGHDLGTAYMTGAMKALAASFTNETLSGSETMFMLNHSLLKFLPQDEYATACYMKFDRQSMTIEVVNAGHPVPIFQRANGQLEELTITGDVLGMFDTVTCNYQVIDVKSGDRIFLFTDGLIEAQQDLETLQRSRTKGLAYVTEVLMAKPRLPLQHTVEKTVTSVLESFYATIDDDIILLGVEF